MGYLGSPRHIVEMIANYIRAKITGESVDPPDRIDRQRQIVGLILFIIFIGLPAAFLLLWMYFPDFAARLFR
ncbi:MAG TPA: hypothetical protein VIW21_13470 [Chthoniobacterales bacterium]|jgi:hypothetical protein